MSRSLRLLSLILGLFMSACGNTAEISEETPTEIAPRATSDFAFTSNGNSLSGVLDAPADGDAHALIIIVHGYGETDVRGWNMHSDLRERFTALGIATAIWDKPGMGMSEGEFDINQSVYESATEVLDAANYLREINAPGSDNIGIWGVSRGGWIAPIALSQDENFRFWISVSGVTAEDNFTYLLLSNMPHEGYPQDDVDQVSKEWKNGCDISRTGGAYDLFLEATPNLRANDYITRMRGEWPTRPQYEEFQQSCEDGSCERTDNEYCSYVWIEDFDEMLSSLDIDVLAIFGEKDSNVDWNKTRDFYQNTIGLNENATLVIHTFADADHNLHIAETGSLSEIMSMTAPEKSAGYYDVQIDWLKSHVIGNKERRERP